MSRWPLTNLYDRGVIADRPLTADVPAHFRYYATDDWGGSEYINTASGWLLLWSRNVKLSGALTAQTSYTFSSLDGDADNFYELEVAGSLSTADARLYIKPNNDSAANYMHAMNGTDDGNGAQDHSSASQSDGLYVARSPGTAVPNHIFGVLDLAAQSGRRRVATAISGSSRSDQATGWMRQQEGGSVWRNTTHNITSLVMYLSAGNFTGELTLRRLDTPA